jgi:cytosine/adenosine deaminase-related metal-dependent hydrolase
VTAADIFTAATIGGARALGRDDLGRIAPGAKADFVMVNIAHPAMQPLYDPVRSMVYAAGERAVRHVFVGGQKLCATARRWPSTMPTRAPGSQLHSVARSIRCLASIGSGAVPPRSCR